MNTVAARNPVVAAIKAEVDRMSKRREAISAQLGSLRDLMAGFGNDDDTES